MVSAFEEQLRLKLKVLEVQAYIYVERIGLDAIEVDGECLASQGQWLAFFNTHLPAKVNSVKLMRATTDADLRGIIYNGIHLLDRAAVIQIPDALKKPELDTAPTTNVGKHLPTGKLDEMVRIDRVQGMLGAATEYTKFPDGCCLDLCTMVGRKPASGFCYNAFAMAGRTISRSRSELTQHENELGAQPQDLCLA